MLSIILTVVKKIKAWAYGLINRVINADNFNHFKSKADNANPVQIGGYHGLVFAVKNCKLDDLDKLLENPALVSKVADNENFIYQYALTRSKMYARFLPIVNRLQRVPEIIEKFKNADLQNDASGQSPRFM